MLARQTIYDVYIHIAHIALLRSKYRNSLLGAPLFYGPDANLNSDATHPGNADRQTKQKDSFNPFDTEVSRVE